MRLKRLMVLMVKIEKIVVITKKTALEELIERLNTIGQAKFYLVRIPERSCH